METEPTSSAGHADGEQLRRIQSISDAALSHLELDELLGELLVRIRDLLETDTVAFLLLDEETDELVARAAKGLEAEVEAGTRIPLGKGFAGRVAAERRVVALPDVDHADVLNPILREKGVKSLLGAPLVVRDRVLGIVHVGTLTQRDFTPADAALLQFAADRAALAIDHGRTYEAARALADRLERVQRVTDVALTHLSTQDLLDELVVRVREILDADTCAVLLLDEARSELVATAAAGLEEEVEAGVRIPLGRGFAGRIAAEARPIALGEVNHKTVLNPILREKGIESLLGAPLLAHGKVLGVIHVGSLRPRVFNREEADLLETAAGRAALGLERALVHERLSALDRIRHRYVAVASHELRTPTAAILGSAATLVARADQLDPEEESALRTMLLEQAQRLAALIEQLLDLSRLEAHSGAMRLERRRVRELVEQTLLDLTEDERRHVALEVGHDLEIEADPVAFERIVSNLVRNALRHGRPPIVISAGGHGGGLRLEVEDAGHGVPADARERIFDEFERADAASGTPGSGLGLAIARSYARAHGGDLVLLENGEPGARFLLSLPRG